MESEYLNTIELKKEISLIKDWLNSYTGTYP